MQTSPPPQFPRVLISRAVRTPNSNVRTRPSPLACVIRGWGSFLRNCAARGGAPGLCAPTSGSLRLLLRRGPRGGQSHMASRDLLPGPSNPRGIAGQGRTALQQPKPCPEPVRVGPAPPGVTRHVGGTRQPEKDAGGCYS